MDSFDFKSFPFPGSMNSLLIELYNIVCNDYFYLLFLLILVLVLIDFSWILVTTILEHSSIFIKMNSNNIEMNNSLRTDNFSLNKLVRLTDKDLDDWNRLYLDTSMANPDLVERLEQPSPKKYMSKVPIMNPNKAIDDALITEPELMYQSKRARFVHTPMSTPGSSVPGYTIRTPSLQYECQYTILPGFRNSAQKDDDTYHLDDRLFEIGRTYYNYFRMLDRCILIDMPWVSLQVSFKSLSRRLARLTSPGMIRRVFVRESDLNIRYVGIINGFDFCPVMFCWNCQDYEISSFVRSDNSPNGFDEFGLTNLFSCPPNGTHPIQVFEQREQLSPFCPAYSGIPRSEVCIHGPLCVLCPCVFCLHESEQFCPVHSHYTQYITVKIKKPKMTIQSFCFETAPCEAGMDVNMFLDSVLGDHTTRVLTDEMVEILCQDTDFVPVKTSDSAVVKGNFHKLYDCPQRISYRTVNISRFTLVLVYDEVYKRHVNLVLGISDTPIVYAHDDEDYSMYDYLLPVGADTTKIFSQARKRYKHLWVADRTYATLNIVHRSVNNGNVLVRFTNKSNLNWQPPSWEKVAYDPCLEKRMCYVCREIYVGKCIRCSSHIQHTASEFYRMRELKRQQLYEASVMDVVPNKRINRTPSKSALHIEHLFNYDFMPPEKTHARFPGKVTQLGPKKVSEILMNKEFYDSYNARFRKQKAAGVFLRPKPVREEDRPRTPIPPPSPRQLYMRKAKTEETKVNAPPPSPVSNSDLQLESLLQESDSKKVIKPNVPTFIQGAGYSSVAAEVSACASNINKLVDDVRAFVERTSIESKVEYARDVFDLLNKEQLGVRTLGLIVGATRHGIEWNQVLFFLADLMFDVGNAVHLATVIRTHKSLYEEIRDKIGHASGNLRGEEFKKFVLDLLETHDPAFSKTWRKPRAQAGLGDLFSNFLAIISGLSAKTMKYLRNFNTIVCAWKNGQQFGKALISLLPACIKELFGLVTDAVLLTEEDLEEFVDKFSIIEKSFTANPRNLLNVERNVLVELHAKSSEFVKQASMSIVKGHMFSFVRHAQQRLATMIALHDDHKQLSFQRYNPLAVLLYGPPGVGKSELARKIAAQVEEWATDNKLREDPIFATMAKPGMYSYQSQLEYMDGYGQQGVVVVDELGSRADGDDLTPFFSLVSSNIYVCPMASLDNSVIGKKGTTFTSHTVIACSNTNSFNHLNTTFINPAALNRRFNFKIKVICHPHLSRKPDFSHLRFKIDDTDGTEYTLPQLLYILKNHDYGFFNHFRNQRTIDHSIIEIEQVALPSIKTDVVTLKIQTGRATGVLATIAMTLQVYWGTWLILPHNSMLARLTGIVMSISGMVGLVVISIQSYQINALSESNKLLSAVIEFGIVDIKNTLRQSIARGCMEIQSRGAKNLAPRKVAKFSVVGATKSQRVEAQSYINELTDAIEEDETISSQEKVRLKEFLKLCTNAIIAFDNFEKTVDVTPIKANPQEQRLVGLVTQGVNDSVALSMEQRFANIMMFIELIHEGDELAYSWLNAIPLGGTWFLVPKHLFELAVDTDKVKLSWPGANLKCESVFSDLEIIDIAQDAVAVSIAKMPFRVPTTLRYFISERDLPVLKDGPMSMVTRADNSLMRIYSFHGCVLEETEEYHGHTKSYSVVRGFNYEANTEVGDCGAPIIAHDVHLPNKLVGIHVAGQRYQCYGVGILITREMLENAIPTKFDSGFEPTKCVTMGAIRVIGKHEPPIFVPRKTVFERSHISSLPVEKFPVDLRRTKDVDPVFNAMMKNSYNRDEYESFDDVVLHNICDELARDFPKDRNARLLTVNEAISGWEGCSGLNLKTSPGYPYVLDSRKSDYIIKKEDGEYIVINDKILNDIDELEKECFSRPPNITWISCGKDECLKPGKEPRIFEIAPVHYTIVARRYFGHFISYIHSNPGWLMMAIGINPESSAWHEIYSSMAKVASSGLANDWKKYDSRLRRELMLAVIYLVNLWYQDRFAHVRRNICEALLNRITIFDFLTLFIPDGNPSGHFLTAIMNSLCNVLMHCYFWMENAPLPERDLFFFRKFVCLYVYGDDSIMSVAHCVRDWFNFPNLKEYFARFGMILSLDTKDEGDFGFRSLLELTFLKRSFVLNIRSQVIPQLSWTSMCTMLNFIRKSKYSSYSECFHVNARMFSQFLYFYGRHTYDKYVSELKLTVPSYDYYNRLFYGEQPFPLQY